MANKGDISKVALPNGDEYNFKDKYVRENYRALNNNDFDTINVTELNSGNIINTGAARFLNTINGSISGNAATATNVAWSGVTGKPTTIAGYGITDAKIANGVITLGSNTITPLTSHQTVSNKGATLAWSTTSTIATIGGTDIKVTMPGNPNTNTTYTLSADTTNNKITLTPSSGTAQSITVPYATSAGSAGSATKATQDESGNNIKATYASSISISDHTITLKNKNGASLGTVTVPDNNTTYTLGTSGNNVTLTPSSGTAQSITVPYATSATTATKATQDGNGNTITSTYLPLAGGTMSGDIIFPNTVSIYQNQNSTSNYTTIVEWKKGGTSQASYDPEIGQHNTGGSDKTGSIILLPYATDAEPWGGSVGLFIAKNTIKLDNKYVGRFTANPTSGQVVITDGADGGVKSSGYTIAKSVPSNAVFTDTDTKNTAGSTDTSSKIFLIGATSQAANPQTYSDNEIYVTSGVLTTKSVQVGGGSVTMQYNNTTQSLDFVFVA